MDNHWGTAVVLLLLIGLVLALARLVAVWRGPRVPRAPAISESIEGVRSVGELAVFKVFTKEIVSQNDHSWGEFGERYLSWLLTRKKMVMIFEFEIEFRFDLRDAAFRIVARGPRAFDFHMPPARHEVHIRDISVYDEQKARLMPWLLPDLLNGFIAGTFPEQDKNRLIAAARSHAEQRALEQILRLQADLRISAQATLRPVARAFGAEDVVFHWDAEKQPAVVIKLAEHVAA
jgi:hypothetical protein